MSGDLVFRSAFGFATPFASLTADRDPLARMLEHPDAPRWRWKAGDRLDDADLAAIDAFRGELAVGRASLGAGGARAAVLEWVARRRDRVPSFRQRIPRGLDLERRLHEVPTSSREDLASRPETLVPDDADLRRMIVYRTAGTTGHALLVPHDRRAVGCYCALLEVALAAHGANVSPGPQDVACFNVGAQARTVTYATRLGAWRGAGFAKLNLVEEDWPSPEAVARFFDAMQPSFLTGDPTSFAEMLRRGVPRGPRALVTTAVALSAGLRKTLEAAYGCPVIDWYSLTETGPIAFGCPRRAGAYHLLCHDLLVEAIDAAGMPVSPGERGEIAVTGGRNPFVPLLRYRTGDWGRIEAGPCACGDPAPMLVELEGRAPCVLFASDGRRVNPVDVSRVLRELPLVQHELVQRRDRSVEISFRAVRPNAVDADRVRASLTTLLGDLPISAREDATLGDRTSGGKATPYRSEAMVGESGDAGADVLAPLVEAAR